MIQGQKIIGYVALVSAVLLSSVSSANSWQQRAPALKAACSQDSQFPTSGSALTQFQWMRSNETNSNLSAGCLSYIASEQQRRAKEETTESAAKERQEGPGGEAGEAGR